MKPFNLDHAKAGAPVLTDKGYPARILAFDRATTEGMPLVVLIAFPDGGEAVRTATSCGRVQHNCQLHMAPLGIAQGREVYTGDELVNPAGETVAVHPTTRGDLLNGWGWPVSYPQTTMSAMALSQAFYQNANLPPMLPLAPGERHGFHRAADAAIKHGIETGQLYDAKKVQTAIHRLIGKGVSINEANELLLEVSKC